MANIAAAIGVPNSAAKAALMPHIIITLLSFSSSLTIFPSRFPRLPPSCSAAPSRPTDAPKKWLTTVEKIMSGATLDGTSPPECIPASIRFVPLSFSLCRSLYAVTITIPPTGRSRISHVCAILNVVTNVIALAKSVLTPPATNPTSVASASHFNSINRFLPIGLKVFIT